MRVIVFAAHKGGCGRSTLATCLAVAAREAGENVAIFDLDPKGCASQWSARRMDPHLPVRTLLLRRLAVDLDRAAKQNTTLALIDTPVLESSAARGAIKAADLIIVPALPAAFDIWAATVTGRKFNLKKGQFVFLLNQCPAHRESRRVRASIRHPEGRRAAS